MSNWILLENDANIELMSKTLGISEIAAYCLANRGIRSKNTAVKFLNPQKTFLLDPIGIKDFQKAAKLIVEAISGNDKICVYGDYDVDGVTSTTILIKTLNFLGANTCFYIPERAEEGYGLNISAIENLCASGVSLLVTCDNGIASIKEIEKAKELGMKVVVFDHHEPGFVEENEVRRDIIPPADAVCDPKQSECNYPFKSLCAAGISFKFSQYIHSYLNKSFELEDELLVFAAIATFCDVVDLTDENRIIARLGIALLNGENRGKLNLGLKALIQKRGLTDKKIGSFEIGYILGPCINASGRLDNAAAAVSLFTETLPEKIVEMAERLVSLNEERKILTTNSVETSLEFLKTSPYANDKVLVFYDETIHESIAGIVAGRLKEKTNRPVIVLTKSNDLAKGSARSVEAYNIYEELYKCRDLFLRFGGHKMAAGLTLEQENIEILRKRLNDACILVEEDFMPKLYADMELTLDDVTSNLAEELDILEPFGKANREPLFITKAIYTQQIELIGDNKKTMRLTFSTSSGRKIKAAAFNKLDYFLEQLRKKYSAGVCDSIANGNSKNLTVKMDILYYVDINDYNGNKYLQLVISDFKI